jgi:hypothetical protein
MGSISEAAPCYDRELQIQDPMVSCFERRGSSRRNVEGARMQDNRTGESNAWWACSLARCSLLIAGLGVLMVGGCKEDDGECVGDCVCEGSDCVCPSTGDCQIHCGDDCNLTCAGSGNCDFICDVACDVACTNTGECLVDVQAGSTVACTSSGDCYVTCRGDCDVDCAGSGDCIVYCPELHRGRARLRRRHHGVRHGLSLSVRRTCQFALRLLNPRARRPSRCPPLLPSIDR